jgi:hypothetical protein
MSKYGFTFGQQHVHSVGGFTYDHDVVVVIEADDYGKAREIMFESFKDKWSMQYEEDQLDDQRFLEHFPRGLHPFNFEED